MYQAVMLVPHLPAGCVQLVPKIPRARGTAQYVSKLIKWQRRHALNRADDSKDEQSVDITWCCN